MHRLGTRKVRRSVVAFVFLCLPHSVVTYRRLAHRSATESALSNVDSLPPSGFRVLELDGFTSSKGINTKYVEQTSQASLVGGSPTFWSTERNYFIFKCPEKSLWLLTYAHAWNEIKAGDSCNGIAHAPHNQRNLFLANAHWKEYIGSEWVSRPDAGVVRVSTACGAYNHTHCVDESACKWHDGRCMPSWDILGESPKFSDVKQGDLGTCYFLTVLASIAYRHPEVIENCFVERERWQLTKPVFTTRFLLTGQPTYVSVDDFVPVVEMDRLAFVSKKSSQKMWPVVMEKAWAKVFGSFKAVEVGHEYEAVRAIAQAPVMVYIHQSDTNLDRIDTLNAASPDIIWENLKLGTQNNFPMMATTVESHYGLAAGHSYAVLEASQELASGPHSRAVVMYNPWGRTNYNGTVPRKFDDGRFTMLFEEYLEAFVRTSVAELRSVQQDGKSISYMTSPLVLSKGHKGRLRAVLEFERSDDAPFSIQVEWPSKRLMEVSGCEAFSPGVQLAVSNGQVTVEANYTSTDTYLRRSNVHVDLPGGVGTYKVSVFAQFHNEPWLNEVVLNAYAPQQVNFKHTQSTSEHKSVLISGFIAKERNAWYSVRHDVLVNGVQTYWARLGGHFLWWCSTERKWWLGPSSSLDGAINGSCMGYAYAPKNRDVLDPALVKGWKEYSDNEWHTSASSGVTDISTLENPAPDKLRLSGFSNQGLNSIYSRRGTDFRVNEQETYWAASNAYFLFLCPSDSRWWISNSGSFQSVKDGRCLGLAHAPQFTDIFHPEPVKNWHEYINGKWNAMPDAGVVKSVSLPKSFRKMPKRHVPQIPAQCDRLLTRLAHLNDWRDIIAQGEDLRFPRNMSSIARGNETCGDAANGIKNSCDKYNRWSNFDAILSEQVPL